MTFNELGIRYSISEADEYMHDGIFELTTLNLSGGVLRFHGYIEKLAGRYLGRYEVTVHISSTKRYLIRDEAKMSAVSIRDVTQSGSFITFHSHWPTTLTVETDSDFIQIATEPEPFALQEFFRFKKIAERKFGHR